jgi:hypothetical protein
MFGLMSGRPHMTAALTDIANVKSTVKSDHGGQIFWWAVFPGTGATGVLRKYRPGLHRKSRSHCPSGEAILLPHRRLRSSDENRRLPAW